MDDFDEIMNWDAYRKNSETFKNNKPFKFAFIEDIFNKEFQEKLYKTYPKYDESWKHYQDYSRSSRNMELGDPKQFLEKENSKFSSAWNKFFRYLATKDFVENMSKFTGIEFEKVVHVGFINSNKGDFSLPHIDGYNNSDGSILSRINVLMYFNKGWQKGDPGGTYICENEDESSLLFEPYNLDNSLVCFEETPNSWHGSRFIIKDVGRQAVSFALS